MATKASLQRPYKDQILTALDLFHVVELSLNGINAEFLTCADWQTEKVYCVRGSALQRQLLEHDGCTVSSHCPNLFWEYGNSVLALPPEKYQLLKIL